MGGRDQSERLVAINWNRWSQSAGARKGEPGSNKRYEKLVRFLQNNIESNQSKPNMKLAVKDWSEDLAWVEKYTGEEN